MGCNNTTPAKKKGNKIDHELTPEEKDRLEKCASRTNIRKIYQLEKVLGAGGFGTVKLAHLRTNTHKQVAVKIIEKKNLQDRYTELLKVINLKHKKKFT